MGSPTCPTCGSSHRDVYGGCRVVVDGRYSPDPWHTATPTPPAPADDARPMVTGGGLIKFDRRADDASGAEAKPIRWIACPNGDHYDERATTFDDEREAHRYAGDKNSEPVDGETWDVLPLYAAPLPARDDAVEDAREIDDERYSFFYAALAYAKARSLARTGGDAAIVGATDVIFDRAFENLGDDATWLTVAAERDAALRREKGGA